MKLTPGTVGVVAAVTLAASCGAGWQSGQAAGTGGRPGLLLNLTSGTEDLHAVTMALQLADHALADGRAVTIFLNVRAPQLARRDLSDKFSFHGNPPIRKLLADLIANGAQVIVCRFCADVMNVTGDDLASGMSFATRESLFGRLGPNVAVFTY